MGLVVANRVIGSLHPAWEFCAFPDDGNVIDSAAVFTKYACSEKMRSYGLGLKFYDLSPLLGA